MSYNHKEIENCIEFKENSENIEIEFKYIGLLSGRNIKWEILVPSSGEQISDVQKNDGCIIIKNVRNSELQCSFTASNDFYQKDRIHFTISK